MPAPGAPRVFGLDQRGALAFAFVGFAATAIYFVLAVAGSHVGLPASLSSLVAYGLAALWSYTGHRWLTFRSSAPASETAPRFAALTLAQYGIALAVPAGLADYAGLRAEIAYLAVCMLVPATSLVLMPRYVFTRSPSTAAHLDLAGKITWPLVFAAAILLACLLTGEKILADPDTQWHIATGRLMFEARALLREDVLSHTFSGHAWIAKEWLSQLVLAATHKIAGWQGVILLTAACVATAGALVARHVADREGNAAGAAAALLMFAIIAATIVARPHVLVFPVVVAWTIALVRSTERSGRPPWLALPLLALWANLHAGFTIGVLIAACIGLEALLNTKPANRIRTAAHWAAFGIACALACIATPHGWAPLLLNAQMAGGNEAMQFIGEWRGFALTPRWAFLTALVIATAAALAANWRANVARLLLLLVLAYATFKHERFAMILGLVVPVIAGPALWRLAKATANRLDLFKDGLALPPAVTPARTLAALGIAAAIALAAGTSQPPAIAAPYAALAKVPADLREKPVFNSYNLGGFLAFKGVKTFIDGRTDQLFLGGFITRMMRAASAREPTALSTLLDEHNIAWALISADTPETRQFPRLPSWRLLHKDASAQVWVRMH